MSKLVLVRHGESQWNEKGLWTGWTDIGLTKKGEDEARQAAQAVRDISFNFAISSPLIRAYKTLQIMLKELHLNSLNVIKSDQFKERDYGQFTGKNKWEIKKEVGDKKFLAIRRGWNEPIPGGETLKDVFERVKEGFTALILPRILKNENILHVSHGNTIRALIKYIENISDDAITSVEIATGEVLVYTLDSGGKLLNKDKRVTNSGEKHQIENSL